MTDGGPLIALSRAQDGTFSEISSDAELQQALADEGGLVWVDLLIGSEADARVLSEVFQFHPLTIEDCASPQIDPAKADDYDNYLFIVVQALAPYVAHEELRAFEVDLYLGHNFVVSCHQEPASAVDRFRERCRRDEGLLSRGSDWLLHGLLDALVDEYLPIVDAVDDTIDRLEEEVLRHPETYMLQQIMMVKRNSLRLRRATTPQRDIMNRLSRAEYPKLIREETAIYYRDVYDHLVRIEYLVEALRDLADGALNTYLSVVSNRLNEVMKILTVAFVPLTIGTLISGIYGMNLTAGFWPPTDANWGFPAVLATMTIAALLAVAFFRHRRWI